MREIRFKVWDGQKMHGPERIQLQWLVSGEITVRVAGDSGYGYGKSSFVKVDNPVLIESAGLKDTKGFFIYEGDIVKVGESYIGDHCFPPQTAQILFESAQFYVDCDGEMDIEMHSANSGIEVIGNKWENPELLK